MQNWMIWVALGIVVLFFIMIYNRIIALVQQRKNSFSDIEVQLKLRRDLIPGLVETVKGYAAHEKGTIEKVTEARAAAMRGGTISDRVQSEAALGTAMMKLMAVAENYPQLKADANFRQLQSELSDIENKIAAARRFFNNATNEYNTAIQQFPALLVARLLGYKEEIFFALNVAEQQETQTPPKISF